MEGRVSKVAAGNVEVIAAIIALKLEAIEEPGRLGACNNEVA